MLNRLRLAVIEACSRTADTGHLIFRSTNQVCELRRIAPFRAWLIGFICCLALLSVPAAASAFGLQDIENSREAASKLIQAYLEIEAPSPQDLEKLLAEPKVRNYGTTAVFHLMQDNIPAWDGEPPAAFDPGENIRLFNLLEVLIQTPSAPPDDDPEEARTIKLMDTVASADDLLASGVQLMVGTFAAAQDLETTVEYYNRLKTFPRKPKLDLTRAGATLSLVQLHCRLGNLASAADIYKDFDRLASWQRTRLYRGQAAASLVKAFSEAGRMDEAQAFYAEMMILPQDIRMERHKVTAVRALMEGYKKIGDLEAAGEYETLLKAGEERIRIAEEKDQATQRLIELYGPDKKD